MKLIWLIIAVLCLSSAVIAIDTSQPTNNYLEMKKPECSCTANYTTYLTANYTNYQNSTETDPVFTAGNVSIWEGINNKQGICLTNGSGAYTYNQTYHNCVVGGTGCNSALTSTYNYTYAVASAIDWAQVVFDAYNDVWSADIDTNDSAYIHEREAAWNSTSNLTYDSYAVNVSKNWSQLAFYMWNDTWSAVVVDTSKLNETDQRYNETDKVNVVNTSMHNDYLPLAGGAMTGDLDLGTNERMLYGFQGQFPETLTTGDLTATYSNIGIATFTSLQKGGVNVCLANGTNAYTYNASYAGKVSSQWVNTTFGIGYAGNANVSGLIRVNGSGIQIRNNVVIPKNFEIKMSTANIGRLSIDNTIYEIDATGHKFYDESGGMEMSISSAGLLPDYNKASDLGSSSYNFGRLYVQNITTLNTGVFHMTANSTARRCVAANEGEIYYDGTANKHYGCNGAAWNAFY